MLFPQYYFLSKDAAYTGCICSFLEQLEILQEKLYCFSQRMRPTFFCGCAQSKPLVTLALGDVSRQWCGAVSDLDTASERVRLIKVRSRGVCSVSSTAEQGPVSALFHWNYSPPDWSLSLLNR